MAHSPTRTPTPQRAGRPRRALTSVIVQPLQAFMHTEIAGGLFLFLAAVTALVWANSPARGSYQALWELPLTISVGPFAIAEDLRHWVNDLLMAFFFFVVGLEIKRELVLGELRDLRAAALPLVCALGGMVGPALIYAAVNAGGPAASGWGVPMATDIAFAVGVLALVGSRVPASLKVFLLTLAVADDLGAIVVIAAFYSSGVDAFWLLAAAAAVVAVALLRRVGVRRYVWYLGVAAVLWLAIFQSGVHATVAGVILGFFTPSRPLYAPEDIYGLAGDHLEQLRANPADGIAHEDEQATLLEVARISREGVSPLARLEAALHPWTSFLVLPLFALANAGVELSGERLGSIFAEPVTVGIILGLVLGKPLGVMAAAFVMVRLGVARLPTDVGWTELLGVGLLAGIGFTVAIFIAGLAFPDPELTEGAKVGILAASAISGVTGVAFLVGRGAATRRA